VRSSLLRGVAQDHADLIASFEPFATHPFTPAAAPLAQLHELWNEDKHRVVTATSAAIGALQGTSYVKTPLNPKDVQVIPVRDVVGVHEAWSFWGTPLDGHPVVEVRITASGPKPEMQLKGKSIAGLCVLDREPLNYVIAGMGSVVERLLIAFRRADAGT